MRGKDHIHVVYKAGAHDRVGAAHAFFGWLKYEFDDARQALAVFHDPAGDGQSQRRMRIVPAGVHQTGVLRTKALLVGKMFGIGRFFYT